MDFYERTAARRAGIVIVVINNATRIGFWLVRFDVLETEMPGLYLYIPYIAFFFKLYVHFKRKHFVCTCECCGYASFVACTVVCRSLHFSNPPMELSSSFYILRATIQHKLMDFIWNCFATLSSRCIEQRVLALLIICYSSLFIVLYNATNGSRSYIYSYMQVAAWIALPR